MIGCTILGTVLLIQKIMQFVASVYLSINTLLKSQNALVFESIAYQEYSMELLPYAMLLLHGISYLLVIFVPLHFLFLIACFLPRITDDI